ncbi:hypothetical protein ABIB15_001297 [Marisediminicola sp. UYEF4]
MTTVTHHILSRAWGVIMRWPGSLRGSGQILSAYCAVPVFTMQVLRRRPRDRFRQCQTRSCVHLGRMLRVVNRPIVVLIATGAGERTHPVGWLLHGIADVARDRLPGAMEAAILDPSAQLPDIGRVGIVRHVRCL